MKKIAVFLLSIIGALTVLSGCTKKNEGPEWVINDPEPFYVCGLLEECSDSIHYCTLKSMEITSSYVPEEGAQDGGSGYYVIIGADTNLSENDFSNSKNIVMLHLEENQSIKLYFLAWDAENGKLIYGIPYIESLDYLQLCNFKASDRKPDEHTLKIPALDLILDYYSRNTLVVEGKQYVGGYFWLELE